MKLSDIQARNAALYEELVAITEAADARAADEADTTEVRGFYILDAEGEPTEEKDPHYGLTEEEALRWDEIEAERRDLEARGERLTRLGAAPKVTTEDEKRFNVSRTITDDGPHDFDRARDMTATEARGMALAAVEAASVSDDATEAVVSFIEGVKDKRFMKDISLHAIGSSKDEYRSAFQKLIFGQGQFLLEEERAAVLNVEEMRAPLDISTSGYSMPIQIDPSFIRTGDIEENTMRAVADVRTINTNRHLVNTISQVTASWDAEAEEVSDDTPTAGTIEIRPVKPQAFVEYTYEARDDVAGLESELVGLLAEGKNTLESVGFLTGTGVGNQPQGFLTGMVAAGGATVTAAAANQVTTADMRRIRAALGIRYRNMSPSWIMEQSVADIIRELETGGAGQRLWQESLQPGNPDQIWGAPARDSASAMPGTDAAGNLTAGSAIMAYGSFRGAYRIVDRVGATLTPLEVMLGANNRPTGKAGLYLRWRVGAGVINPLAARLLLAA